MPSPSFLARRAPLLSLLLVIGCAGGSAQGLWLTTPDLPPEPEEARIVRESAVEFEEAPETIKFLVTGDTGRRDKSGAVHPDALLVRDAAALACGKECLSAFFLGDNVYPNGVNEEEDVEYLRAFTGAYLESTGGFVKDVYFTPGNHDWGPVFPRRTRLNREFDAIDQLGQHVHGASHFYALQMDALRVASLDSNYIVQHCDALFSRTPLGRGHSLLESDEPRLWERQDLQCLPPPTRAERRRPINEAFLRSLLRGKCDGPDCRQHTVALGHHPWFGNGTHGTAGWYRDLGSFSLGNGSSYRVALERVVRDRAALYLAGHDHGVHVHLDPKLKDSLAITVGSGSKVSGRAKKTLPGEKFHQADMALEGFCRLGFAVVEHSWEGLGVNVYSLNGSETEKCLDEQVLDSVQLGEPVKDATHDLRCRRWEFREGTWSEAKCDEETSDATVDE